MAIEDCYFFMSGQCNKGSKCPFRHSENAKSTLEMCEDYRLDGVCTRPDCGKKHSRFHLSTKSFHESDPFSKEHCYFERVKGACTKDSCAFRHFKKSKIDPDAAVFIPTPDAGLVDGFLEAKFEVELQRDCEALKMRLNNIQTSFDHRMTAMMQELEVDNVY